MVGKPYHGPSEAPPARSVSRVGNRAAYGYALSGQKLPVEVDGREYFPSESERVKAGSQLPRRDVHVKT